MERTVAEARGPARDARRLSASLDERIDRRAAFLADYQDAAYAARYRSLVDRVRAAEETAVGARRATATARCRWAPCR